MPSLTSELGKMPPRHIRLGSRLMCNEFFRKTNAKIGLFLTSVLKFIKVGIRRSWILFQGPDRGAYNITDKVNIPQCTSSSSTFCSYRVRRCIRLWWALVAGFTSWSVRGRISRTHASNGAFNNKHTVGSLIKSGKRAGCLDDPAVILSGLPSPVLAQDFPRTCT
jgi:hypothetical protein